MLPEVIANGELGRALHNAIEQALGEGDARELGCSRCGAVVGESCTPEGLLAGVSRDGESHPEREHAASASRAATAALRVLTGQIAKLLAAGAAAERAAIVELLREVGGLEDEVWAAVAAADLVEALRTP